MMLWIAVAVLVALPIAWIGWKRYSAPSKIDLEQSIYGLPLARPIQEHGGLRHESMRWDGVGRDADGRAMLTWFRAGPEDSESRPTLVFVHPTPHTLLSFVDTWFGEAGLVRDFDLVAIEVIGHGVARPKVGAVGFQDCADWLRAALEHLQLEDVVLIGQSYGGEVAWRAALDAGDRVSGLVLLDSSGLERRDGDWLPEERAMRSMSLATAGWMLNSRSRVESALKIHYESRPPDPDQVTAVYETCNSISNWRAMVGLCRDENGERFDDLAGFDRPTLLLWGALDKAYEPAHYAEAFRRVLKDSELTLIQDCGHYPQEDRPAETARLIRRFVQARVLR